MLIAAIVLFLIAAVGGSYMAMQIFNGRRPSGGIAALHGVVAASGLGALAWFTLHGAPGSFVKIGLGVLVVAALGGFYLLGCHVRGRPHPKPVVVIHALAAVCGVGLLAYTLL
jgi:hypothetical protein